MPIPHSAAQDFSPFHLRLSGTVSLYQGFPRQFTDCLEGLTGLKHIFLPIPKVYFSERRQRKITKGKDTMSSGNQAHVFNRPFPVESQRTCLIPTATVCSLETQHLRF